MILASSRMHQDQPINARAFADPPAIAPFPLATTNIMRCNSFDNGGLDYHLFYPLLTPMTCSRKPINKKKPVDSFGHATAMPVDVVEYESKFILKADLPGVPKENIRISVEDHVLSIEATRQKACDKSATCESADDQCLAGCQHMKERDDDQSKLERHLTFPESADFDQVDACLEHGVLTLTIPKKMEDAKRKKDITING